jgi:hypothetical protein
VLRANLGPWFKAEAFTPSEHTPLGWRRRSLLVWCQCDRWGWDQYVGSGVYLNFQTSDSDRAWEGPVRRLPEFLTDDELEIVRDLQDRVVPKRRLPPRDYLQTLRRVFAGSPDADRLVETYLAQFIPDDRPYVRHQDFTLRYMDIDDLTAWCDFLRPLLTRIVKQAEVGSV